MRTILISKLVVLALFLAGCSDGQVEVKYRGEVMGTTWAVKVNSSEGYSQEVADAIQSELSLIDTLMSNWKQDSDVSRFNRAQLNTCTTVSPLTLAVVLVGKRIHGLSEGAFDVTMSPLIDLWGFGTDARNSAIPEKEAIEATMAHVGSQHLIVQDNELCKRDVPINLNLSALAKGFAVDRAANYLDIQGYESYLVEVGGELRARGENGQGRPWTVGIEQPTDNLATINIQAALPVLNSAVATSGDYRNFFVSEEARYSHLINPATGYPVDHNAASVTVLKESSMEADAWATALLVLGPARGLEIANELGLAAMIILRTEQGYETITSTSWPLN